MLYKDLNQTFSYAKNVCQPKQLGKKSKSYNSSSYTFNLVSSYNKGESFYTHVFCLHLHKWDHKEWTPCENVIRTVEFKNLSLH